MQHLTLDDFVLALPDLLERRGLVLESTLAFRLFGPGLHELHDELEALRSSNEGATLLGERLAEADAVHDGFAESLGLFARGFLSLPDLPEEDRDALTLLQREVLPGLDDLSAPYEIEAAKAADRERALTSRHRAHLGRFSIGAGRSLMDLYEAYLESGRQIDLLLRERADATRRRPFGRHAAGILRNRIVSVLEQLRDAMRTELRHRPDRWELLDRTSFAYIDLLERHRQLHGPGVPPLSAPP